MNRVILSVIIIVILLLPASALADTIDPVLYGFFQITSNGTAADNVSSQLLMEVSPGLIPGDGPNYSQAIFRFTNDVGTPSSVTRIFFDDYEIDPVLSVISDISSSINTGINFDSPAQKKDLPGGNDIKPPFIATTGLSADSDTPLPHNGINDNSDWLEITFDLFDEKTTADVINALNSSNLRVGLHVQAIGSNDVSNAYVNKVPEPSFVLLLGIGLCAVFVLSRVAKNTK